MLMLSEKLTELCGLAKPCERMTPSIRTVMIVASKRMRGVFSLCFGYGGFLNTRSNRPRSVRLSTALSPCATSSRFNETKAFFVSLCIGERWNSKLAPSPMYSCSTEKRERTRSMMRSISSWLLVWMVKTCTCTRSLRDTS